MAKPDEAFAARVQELVDALLHAFDEQRPPLPALLLMYATIDIVSALSRPVTDSDTSGHVFRKWVDAYMLPGSRLTCTSDDVWAARCGLLHTLSLSSRLSRTGKAKRICYISSEAGVQRMQQFTDSKGHNVVVVSLPTYVQAFRGGIYKFIEHMIRDEDLRTRVFHHMGDLAEEISFQFRDET